jgi:Fe-S oxidoreductase
MIFIIFAIMLYPNVEHTAREICSTANVARPLYSDKYWIEVAQKNFKENACSEERPRKVNLEEMRERERRLRDQFLKENREREERLHREKMEALFREQREKVQRQERERERIERERQEHERLERERIQREQKEREELEKKRQQRYEELNNFLAKLGFDNRELNMALLRIHDADLQRVINALQQYR